MPDAIRPAFRAEWQAAETARLLGDLDRAFHHLERAHILSQRRTWLHMRSHLGMLRIGWQRGSMTEVIGQLLRLPAALLFSRIWVPVGNSGGSNVSALRRMPVPADLQRILDQNAQ
jgi:hypothetical protein